MSERDLPNALRTRRLMGALRLRRVDVSPGTNLHTVLMEFAHFEATKTEELVAEFQRANRVTIDLKTSEEARRVIDAVRTEKRETIKALADALMEHVGATFDGEYVAPPDVIAALRLVGRL